MAVILDPNDPNNQGMAGGGSVLTGNSGAKSAGPTAAGSGWTNLQTYLGANQGNGAGVANTIVEEGQKAFDVDASKASKASDAWGDSGVSAVSKNDPTSQVTAASQVVNAKGSDYGQTAANASTLQYGGPKSAAEIQGMDGLQKAYKNADDTADNFTRYGTQSATLKDKYKYSGGSAALDTLIGRGDAGTLISDWQARSKAGIRAGDQYTGIAKNTGRINDAAGNAQRGLADAQAQLGKDVAGRQKADADAAQAAKDAAAAQAQREAALAAEIERDRLTQAAIEEDRRTKASAATPAAVPPPIAPSRTATPPPAATNPTPANRSIDPEELKKRQSKPIGGGRGR
jgi:hypothetical protein